MCVYILNTSGPLYAIAIIKFHCIRGSEIFSGIIILSLYIQTQCECDIYMCRIAYAVKGWECVSDNENVKNVDDDHQTQVVECVCVRTHVVSPAHRAR